MQMQAAHIWSSKPFVVVTALYSTAPAYISHKVTKSILEAVCESQSLFSEHQNMQIFANLWMACGPTLDRNLKCDGITHLLKKAAAKASTEAILPQLAVAGLIAARASNWEIERDAALQIFTPPESENGSEGEFTMKTADGAQI